MSATPVALLGVHGHGGSHLRRIAELAADGRVRLSAVVDPRRPDDPPAPWFPTLGDLLADKDPDVRPEIVVISTPIPTHLPLARAAMEAGLDVLLEKPTAASLAEHTAIVETAQRTGRLCQVGFQTFGSHAVDAVIELVAAGEIGELVGIGAVGTWVRTRGYWQRAAWAGRRRLDGRDVVDGVVTNPLAHAVATALRVGGARTAQDVAHVVTDLHRANPIEADDTSSLRIVGRDGLPYGVGLSLCAPERTAARVLALGTEGEITLEYEHDRVTLRTPRMQVEKSYGRTGLLEDLLAARADPGRALACDVRETGAFMRVLEAVRTAPDPHPVAEDAVTWLGEGDDRRPVVDDVERWCEEAARTARTFTELEAPWAR
ncbi:Gfo/Idh/MocA family protein [Cellulosimicrobium arenosum]|uniref:Gfo/Idh/MocA family oxidoreductase n=1 Tax=Cellulosimicrobium arenosum TaxID=2708133 RepID=A0A927G9F9_9MICO|nr:Gfo/Idh/MocA family oxidoreductase [Cellulosimicrobium arenosum]MBD8079397.1 Gfo/Idh/MocA family oxidoreductase [Cellulosimicrobium arenosum]